MRTRWSAGRSDDSGVTLVEMLVASMLSVFLMALVTTLFIRAMDTDKAVHATTGATNAARVQFDAMQQAVRLAVETDVRYGADYTTSSADGKGDLLIVKTRRSEGVVGAASTWRCMGWFLDASGTMHSVNVETPPTGSTPRTATDPAGWPVAATEVQTLGSAPVFLAHDPDSEVEAWYPGSVTVAFQFDPADGTVPVNVSTTVAPRRQLQLDGETPGGAKCAAS